MWVGETETSTATITQNGTTGLMFVDKSDQRVKLGRYPLDAFFAKTLDSHSVTSYSSINASLKLSGSVVETYRTEFLEVKCNRYLGLLTVLLNLVLWLYLPVTIFRQVTSKLTDQGNHSSLALLYIKLTGVLGLTWVFGFLSSIVKTDATAYLFVVVNSLQGEMKEQQVLV